MGKLLGVLNTLKLPEIRFLALQDMFVHVYRVFLSLSALLMLVSFVFLFLSSGDIALPGVAKVKTSLQKNSFHREIKAYEPIGEGLFSLLYIAPKMHLPDLKTHLVYFGQNGRPDVKMASPMLHFSMEGTKEIVSAKPKEKLYLHYQNSGKYSFSPENNETSLWVIPTAAEGEAGVLVGMFDENGDEVSTPENLAHFQLAEKEVARTLQTGWEIGKWRVDGTLLARQRARWMGVDKFLEQHGGEEYKTRSGKSRIDFGEKDDIYSVYLDAGDMLAWKDDRFEAMEPGNESQKYPILVVKKVDERLMNLELWDVEGKKKIALNLLKSMETWQPSDIQQEFKFIGARTRSQYVFEVDSEKMLLSPSDWLIMTDEGWRKITTIEEIDDYVERRLTGTLFVFEGIERNGESQVMKGLLYNPARTAVQNIEMPVQKEGLVYQPLKRNRDERSKVIPQQPYANGRHEKLRPSLRFKEDNKEHIP